MGRDVMTKQWAMEQAINDFDVRNKGNQFNDIQNELCELLQTYTLLQSARIISDSDADNAVLKELSPVKYRILRIRERVIMPLLAHYIVTRQEKKVLDMFLLLARCVLVRDKKRYEILKSKRHRPLSSSDVADIMGMLEDYIPMDGGPRSYYGYILKAMSFSWQEDPQAYLNSLVNIKTNPMPRGTLHIPATNHFELHDIRSCQDAISFLRNLWAMKVPFEQVDTNRLMEAIIKASPFFYHGLPISQRTESSDKLHYLHPEVSHIIGNILQKISHLYDVDEVSKMLGNYYPTGIVYTVRCATEYQNVFTISSQIPSVYPTDILRYQTSRDIETVMNMHTHNGKPQSGYALIAAAQLFVRNSL